MMEDDSNFVISRKLYVEETHQRTAGMIRSLLAMQDDCQGQIDHFLRQLREQAEASRRTSYECIVHLCKTMEDCLARIGDHIEKPRLETAISTLIEACQVISRHAETIAGMADHCESVEVCP